jgi:hypothetical protein
MRGEIQRFAAMLQNLRVALFDKRVELSNAIDCAASCSDCAYCAREIFFAAIWLRAFRYLRLSMPRIFVATASVGPAISP